MATRGCTAKAPRRQDIVINSAIRSPASAKSLLATLNKHSPRLMYRAEGRIRSAGSSLFGGWRTKVSFYRSIRNLEENMTKTNRLHLGLFLAVVLAMQMWPQKAQAAAGRYDQEIQQQAAKVLSTKDKWKGITANTEDGIVTLEGSVSLYVDKVDAGRKIGKINHADGVRNHVQVEGNVPDNELQSKLADKLSYDRIGYGIMFNALSLKVEDGVVTVGGDVRDYPSRDSALAIVETTPGVKDVIDEINVLPTSNFDDDLRIRVARAIYGQATMRRYAMVPQKPIRIIVDNGHIILYGVVDNKMDKQIAETQAKSVSGAFSVDNKLVVANQK